MPSNMITTGIACLGLSLLASSADASSYMTFFGEDEGLGEANALTTFPNAAAAQADFLSSLVGVGVEDFESETPGAGAPLNVNFGLAGTATLQGTGAVGNVTPGNTNGFGRYATSGSQYWEATNDFSITFSQPVAAFGFYGVDIGDFDGQITLELGLASGDGLSGAQRGGDTEIIVVPNGKKIAGGSVLFFGIVTDDPGNLFTSVTFGNTAAGADFFAFDDFTIASIEQVNPIPLPAAAWMGLAGLGLVGTRRLRRNGKA